MQSVPCQRRSSQTALHRRVPSVRPTMSLMAAGVPIKKPEQAFPADW